MNAVTVFCAVCGTAYTEEYRGVYCCQCQCGLGEKRRISRSSREDVNNIRVGVRLAPPAAPPEDE